MPDVNARYHARTTEEKSNRPPIYLDITSEYDIHEPQALSKHEESVHLQIDCKYCLLFLFQRQLETSPHTLLT